MNQPTILITEGVSTALSAAQATGHHAVAALSCGNMRAVTVDLRQRYPAARLIVCSDKGNGEADARRAAIESGALLAIPEITGDGTDWNDLHAIAGLNAVKEQIERATAPTHTEESPSESEQDDDLWPDPLPIETKLDAEPYPLDALPESIRLAIDEVLGFVKAPAPVIAAALSALSMAIQAHADVERAMKLSGPCSLFLLTFAESGERKSTCDGFFTRAIRDYEADQAEDAKPALIRHEAEMTAWEAKHTGVKDSIRQAMKAGGATADKEAELLRLQEEKPRPPRVPKIIYGDATPEALKYSLAKQWPSGAVVSSEAGVVFGSQANASHRKAHRTNRTSPAKKTASSLVPHHF